MAKIKNVVYERLSHKMTKIQAILPVGYCLYYILYLGTPIDSSKPQLNIVFSLGSFLIASYSSYAHIRLVSPRALSFSYLLKQGPHCIIYVSFLIGNTLFIIQPFVKHLLNTTYMAHREYFYLHSQPWKLRHDICKVLIFLVQMKEQLGNQIIS